MSIRVPDKDIDLSSIKIEPVLKWHTLNCELVTPMYGGGVNSAVVDEQMPIRASSIRGQLRFWWRLLAKNKWQLGDDRTIRQLEFALWGGMGSGDTDGLASQVFLRVLDVPTSSKIRQSLIDYDDRALSGLRYVLFPAYNETNPELTPHKLLKPEISWKLAFAFASSLSTAQKDQVIETLQWWASFGGLGFRSRKGLGSVRVTESHDFPQIAELPSLEAIKAANCDLKQRSPQSNALSALQGAVEKLSSFRQAPNIGRNRGQSSNRPGRSRWPEPDALRRIYRTHHNNHTPVHSAGNVFPRAIFGMPILFPFVGHGEPNGDNTVKPAKGERLASPLILRAVYDGVNQKGEAQWRPSALALPYQHILDMQVTVNNQQYPIWQDDTATHTQPIHDNGGHDPLKAFLSYFTK